MGDDLDLLDHFTDFVSSQEECNWLDVGEEAIRVFGSMYDVEVDPHSRIAEFFESVACGGFDAAIKSVAIALDMEEGAIRDELERVELYK